MRTSDPDIFAVGDAVEVKDFVTGEWTLIPLAGPANRQGRIVADVIAGRDSRFRGTQGTSVIGLFGGTVAMTGANEKTLTRLGQTDYEKVYLFPNSHAGYYPGAKTLVLKVIFRKSDGRLLGAQALGRRTASRSGSTPSRWRSRWARRCTTSRRRSCATRRRSAAPRTRSTSPAWRPPTCCAATCRSAHWDSLDGSFLLDVRNPQEVAAEAVPGAVNIPLPQLRARLGELPRDREIAVICRSAVRAYYATRILLQNGFKARNISGGMLSRSMLAGEVRHRERAECASTAGKEVNHGSQSSRLLSEGFAAPASAG